MDMTGTAQRCPVETQPAPTLRATPSGTGLHAPGRTTALSSVALSVAKATHRQGCDEPEGRPFLIYTTDHQRLRGHKRQSVREALPDSTTDKNARECTPLRRQGVFRNPAPSTDGRVRPVTQPRFPSLLIHRCVWGFSCSHSTPTP